MNLYGDNIKYLRKKHGLNQSQMIDLVGVEGATWSDRERGKTKPDLNELIRVSGYFKVSIDDLLKKDLQQEEIKGNLIQEFSESKNSNLKGNVIGNLNPKNYEGNDFISYLKDEGKIIIGEVKTPPPGEGNPEALNNLFNTFKAFLSDLYSNSISVNDELTDLRKKVEELTRDQGKK